ncbi:TolC family outer membrane protein [Mangrovitalea sediminis]|uniref:TolC family outer membrane protein n=1 Tax=Mangrovitalea sediminis TaxID=1982043 RepID=UPI000BE5ADDC|nr:TolC family outer membrane protein [Mangrovitalea sediminis]
MKKHVLSGLIALMASQPALAVDLVQVYEKALSYDSTLAASKYAFDATQAAINQSRAGLLPQLSAVGSVGHTDENLANGYHDSWKTASYGLQLTQPLFQASTWFGYQESKFASKSAEADYNYAQQQLMLDVSTAYFNVLRARDNLTTAKASEAAIKRQWEQAKEQYDVGLIAITGVQEARASYDASISQRISAENNLDIAKEKLARLTGEAEDNLDNLEQDFPVGAPQPNNPKAWEKQSLAQNWSVKSAEYKLQASGQNLKVQKSGYYPTVSLTADYTKNDLNGSSITQTGNGWSRDATIGLQLKMPLYEGGGTQASVRRARATYNLTDEQLSTARRNVSLSARTIFRTINSDIETVAAQRQTIVSSRSALEATRAGYTVGTRNIVEVLNAEQAYYVALKNYANARYDYVINTLTLKQVAGTLSPQDLIDLNHWLSAGAPGIEALANEPTDSSSDINAAKPPKGSTKPKR